MTAATVSIVVPMRDAGATIVRTLDSLSDQPGVVLEVIVVDDRSSDGGPEIARRHPLAPRVIMCRGAGRSAARNTGFGEATGDHLVFLDADDRLDSGALARRAHAARAAGAGAVIVAGYRQVLGSAVRACGVLGDLGAHGDPRLALLRRNQFAIHCALLPRKHVLDLVGKEPFRVGQFAFEDWDLWLRLAYGGARFVPLGVVDCDYVQRAGMTTTVAAAATEALGVIERGATLARATPQDAAWHARAEREVRAARFEYLLWRSVLLGRDHEVRQACADAVRAITEGRGAWRVLPAMIAERAAARWWLWRARR